MKKKINHLFRTFALLILAGVLCCCADDREGFERPGGEKQKEVTFSVQIPVPSLPSTYGLNATSENEVKTIDILLFDSGTGNLTGSTLSANSIADDGAVNKKVFTVKIPEGNYTVVILANCRDILSGVTLTAGESKASALAKLQLNQTAWIADATNAAYKPFPMWGEMPLTVGSGTPATNNMKLTRVLAKIDVSVHSALQGDFKLTSVHLYNRYTQGSVAPDALKWDGTANKVTAPSPLGIKTATALSYTVDNPFKQYLNEIYTFEAAEGTAGTLSTNTCLVIGGKYDGSSVETFYRIDFVKKTGSSVSYLPLLRNHRYDVDIKTIEAPGYATAAAAFAAKPVNIKADISVFDESKITKTVYDDQYMLGVSDDDITFTREARTATHPDNTLSVTTDVPAGWKVLKIIDGSNTDVNIDTNPSTGWIRLNPNNKNTAGTSDTKLILSENTTGSSRSAVIHLIAGRLTLPVKITQTTASALMLTLRDAATNTMDVTDLVFAAGTGSTPPPAQSVRLSWMPIDRAVSVSTAAFGGNAFVYNTGGGLHTPGEGTQTSYPGGTGSLTLNIQPTGSNPLESRISKVDFTVFNGTNYLSKSLFLRQVSPPGLVVDNVQNFYSVNGSTHTLYVRSNATWQIQSVTQSKYDLLNLSASDNLKTSTTGGVDTGTGTPVTFTVANTNNNTGGTVTVVFASTDPQKYFSNVTVVLNFRDDRYYPTPHTGWAGSNIYWDGSKLTFDDVGVTTHQNYQGVFFQWGSLWGLDPSGSEGSAWTSRVYKLTGGSYSYTTSPWTSVPRVSPASIDTDPPSGKTVRDRAYLYEVTNESTGIGDICKYLTDRAGGSLYGSKWRMPTSNEFEAAGSYSQSGTSWSYVTSTDPSGKYENSAKPGYSKTATSPGTYPTTFFPASGIRHYTDGTLNLVGTYGHYWSGSTNGTNGYYMLLGSGFVGTTFNDIAKYGYNVRCVREA